MAREEEEEPLAAGPPKEVDVFTSVRCLGYLSSLTLLVAVCVGMYVRWEVTDEQMILVIFILGLFVLGIASILHYYFAMEKASLSLFHLWFGFLLGLLCFLNSPALDLNIKELVANHLLLGSVVMKTLWALTERICRAVHYKTTLLTSAELLELLGFGVASTAMLLHNSVAIIGLVVALGAVIVDLRMKSLLALLNLAAFALVTSLLFFHALNIAANPYALGCYLGRLLCEPVLDVYFSGLGSSERWLPLLSMGKVWRKLSLLPLSLMELAFFVLAAFKVPSTRCLQRVSVAFRPPPPMIIPMSYLQQLGQLQQWYLVIPGFCLFGLFWSICHVILLITMWGFHTKLSECQRAWRAQRSVSRTLNQVMASRGIRHFCLISERLVLFSMLSTVILGAVSWQVGAAAGGRYIWRASAPDVSISPGLLAGAQFD